MNLKFAVSSLFSMFILSGCLSTSDSEPTSISWDNRLTLPPNSEITENIGLAGAFAGFADGKLIVAGGANFPHGMPWDGGAKKWWTTLYVLDTVSGSWSVHENFLPAESAYGLSFPLADGVLCVGGCNAEECLDDVFVIGFDGDEPSIDRERFPRLPDPTANAAGAMIDGKIYVAGGQHTMDGGYSASTFVMLDTASPENGWQKLSAWPGPSRGYAVGVAQAGKVFLFGGRSYGPDVETVTHSDAFAYDPDTGTWVKITGKPIMAGSAIPFGDDKIIFLGGSDTMLPSTADHPGFSRMAILYDTDTGQFTPLSESQYPIPVTVTAVTLGNDFYMASGEIRPGVRTPNILKGTIITNNK